MVIGIALTGSRSGIIAFVVVVTTYFLISWPRSKSTLIYILAAIAVLILAMSAFGSCGLSHLSTRECWSISLLGGERPSSTEDHIATVTAGIKLFLDSPLVGNGLGYFMKTYWTVSQRAHPIDSTPIWLLAEFGILGFLVFVIPFAQIFFGEWRHARAGQQTAVALVLTLAAFASMSTLYELLYQRIFWITLGALLACVTPAKTSGIIVKS
jgi:hypothetical protein